MSASVSRYVDKKIDLPPMLIERDELSYPGEEFPSVTEWLRCVKQDFPKFIPFLTETCELDIRGRVLEIGAGCAWFSAELSKLPAVVEVVVTDVSAKLLKTEAPRIFRLLKAKEAKITRTALIMVGRVFGARDFEDSRLYHADHRHILRPKKKA